MTFMDKRFQHIPEYYHQMYLDGYTPEEIWYAFHKKLYKDLKMREEAENTIDAVNVKCEVKIKK